MSNKVKVTDNFNKFDTKMTKVFDSALGRMGKDIKQIASIRIPFKSGDLQGSIENKRDDVLKHKVLINSEYAGYQERGVRKDGSHKVRKYTTPNTGKKFLKGAGDDVSKNALNYLKQANQLIKM